MSSAVDRFIEAHPQAGPAWYRALARVAGRALTVPGLRRWRPLARRVHAVTKATGRITVLNEPPVSDRPEAQCITVLSANLWHDWPRQQRWPERLEAFAQLAEAVDADILLLQEVARTPTLGADLWLAERLGLSMSYARANGAVEAIGFEEGPAVLSRFPLGEVHLRQLSHGRNPLARRVALAAHVETPSGRLLVVSVHLGLVQRHNAGQIQRLRSWVADVSEGEAAVIGGDFNAPEHGSEIIETRREWTDTFRDQHPHADATTHTRPRRRGGLRRRLDYIFVQQPPGAPWQVLECGHLDAPGGPHSDHRAVLARIAPTTTPC
ncbi:MAG: endonuclease/exonuclease/phosphatase family protein [Acidimicrobiia bacterium]